MPILYQAKHAAQNLFGPHRSWGARLFFASLILGALSFVGLAGAVVYFSRDLPPIETLRDYKPSLITRVYGEGDQLVGQFFIERRSLVPLNRIPGAFREAIIAVEDARFYEHSGIDPLGILRALVANVGSWSFQQGGSTITQQLSRSLFLSPEKSIARKAREAILARRVEKVLSKDEILELYLNQIYFGHGAYGVQAGSRTYFDKDVDELNLAEIAFLAGLPQAPTDYSPYLHPDEAKRRQGVVLRRMVDVGFITEEELTKTYEENIYFQKQERKKETAAYFLEYIRQHLVSTYGDTMVYKGGLQVHTTLNTAFQRTAEEGVERGLRDLDKRQGWRGPTARKTPEELEEAKAIMQTIAIEDLAVGDILEAIVTAVNPDGAAVITSGLTGEIRPAGMSWARRRLTGPNLLEDVRVSTETKPEEILAVGDVIQARVVQIDFKKRTAVFALEQEPLVEAALISLDPRTGAIKAMVGGFDFKRSEFNRAVMARRQPGSAFKPIIYATALSRGMTPATIVVDAPIVYEDPELKKVWKPENYESKFYGPISLREALTYSRNLATVRLTDQVGIRNVIQFAKRVGITSPIAPDLSLALGSSSVGLLELSSAFGVFANEGVRAEPIALLSVQDANGVALEEHAPIVRSAIEKETAYLITNMMMDVIQQGTGRAARVLGKPLAGKTGTTNDFTDAWFIGYSPQLVTGVWVGFDDRRSLGDREAGASAALPIWISYMRAALRALPDADFSIPEGVVFARIDPKTGKLAEDDMEGAVIEIFAKGTEPRDFSISRPKPSDFFRLDSALNQG